MMRLGMFDFTNLAKPPRLDVEVGDTIVVVQPATEHAPEIRRNCKVIGIGVDGTIKVRHDGTFDNVSDGTFVVDDG